MKRYSFMAENIRSIMPIDCGPLSGVFLAGVGLSIAGIVGIIVSVLGYVKSKQLQPVTE